MEATLSAIKEGEPVPSRAELLLDFSHSLNSNHATTRLRELRPDLYERMIHLEQAARAAAAAEIASVVHRMGRDELKALKQFDEIGRRYGIGPCTVRRLRAEARGTDRLRSRWDWPKVQKLLARLVQTKDQTITSLIDIAGRIGPEYMRKGIIVPTPAPMSHNTFVAHLRAAYPDLHQSLLALAARNRARAKKETP